MQNQIIPAIKRYAIINECGVRDVWPVLANNVTWGYGPTGTYGFGDYNVRDRFHAFKHSDYFSSEFVRRYWVSAIRDETPVFSPTDVAGQGTPLWFGLLGWPLRILLLFALCVAFSLPILAFFSRQGHRDAVATALVGARSFSGGVEWAKFLKSLDPTTEPKLAVIARAKYPTESVEVWVELTKYPRRFVRLDSLSRKIKCDNGETDFCKLPLEQLDISHIMVVTIREKADHHGNIVSLEAGMKDNVGPEISKFHTDPNVFMNSLQQEQVAIGWSGDRENEKQNLVTLRRFPTLQLHVQFADGNHAYFLLEKGNTGARVINDAVDDWLQTIGQE